MTFSLVARDPQTGAFGMVVTSSSPSVAARCTHLRAKTGGVASQNVTDPGLGDAILAQLAAGASAAEALKAVTEDTDNIGYRQLSVVDGSGRTASFSGANTLGTHRTVERDGAVAAGNLLSSPEVPQAIMDAFHADPEAPFEKRLLDGLMAGETAGGEEGPVHSAGLKVVDEHSWPVTDLRVDWADVDPIGQLRDLWSRWAPEKEDYRQRALQPTGAPSYGVPGDQ
jgi:uncharacterized Ntn-hydrolase superfamily protein